MNEPLHPGDFARCIQPCTGPTGAPFEVGHVGIVTGGGTLPAIDGNQVPESCWTRATAAEREAWKAVMREALDQARRENAALEAAAERLVAAQRALADTLVAARSAR